MEQSRFLCKIEILTSKIISINHRDYYNHSHLRYNGNQHGSPLPLYPDRIYIMQSKFLCLHLHKLKRLISYKLII